MEQQQFHYECDTLVVGGGTAGVIAAQTAAENGQTVILIESQLALTGTMANALVTPMMPTQVNNGYAHQAFVKAMTEQAAQPIQQGDATTIWFSPELASMTAERQCRERGVQLFYQTTLTHVEVEANRIKRVFATSFNHQIVIVPKMVIDTSGDAVVARLANIPVVSGDDIKRNQAVSFRFEIGNVNIAKLRKFCQQVGYTFNDCQTDQFFEFVSVPNQKACGELNALFADGVSRGLLEPEDIRYIQAFSMPTKPGVLSFNGPQIPNSDNVQNPEYLSDYVQIGRAMQQRLWQFLRANIPGFETSFINQEARMLGIRESYRIQGVYELSTADYQYRQKFADGIAKGDWYIDIHRDDHEVEGSEFKQKYAPGEYYEIPYRSLIVETIENYIAAGRHISCEFAMQSSIRIQATCQMMGEAAGLATIVSKALQCPLNQIDGRIIKQQLEERTR